MARRLWIFQRKSGTFANVIGYIRNQEEHHHKKTFQGEFEEILKAAGVEYDPNIYGMMMTRNNIALSGLRNFNRIYTQGYASLHLGLWVLRAFGTVRQKDLDSARELATTVSPPIPMVGMRLGECAALSGARKRLRWRHRRTHLFQDDNEDGKENYRLGQSR